jgi:hypothetical protein
MGRAPGSKRLKGFSGHAPSGQNLTVTLVSIK